MVGNDWATTIYSLLLGQYQVPLDTFLTKCTRLAENEIATIQMFEAKKLEYPKLKN